MDVVGSEIGQKMRSAIKAKLTELGCYVDDELPDYVMVMVANKRTRAQMEDDLQLFLGDNTELFVNWLHQVLKKLQEVTVTAPLKDLEKKKERSTSKDRKDKKDKDKSKKAESSKKSKKKEKEKKSKKKDEKKSSKHKKKTKHEMIRPNIPPLLMNMEKESEPSITDVFAGQILKNHGISLESYKDDPKQIEKKIVINELKRPIVPIIDPATISSQIETTSTLENNQKNSDETNETPAVANPRDDNIKEMNKIEAKIQGLRQKLVEQMDSISDDEDFLNIRTEAEELMNDFAEDVFQEISQPPPVTPPLKPTKTLTPIQQPLHQKPNLPKEPETLPQIELNLPKRSIRERLGTREPTVTSQEVKENLSTKKAESPERFTPEKEMEIRPQVKSAKSRLGNQSEPQRKHSVSEETSEKSESTSKRLTSKVSSIEGRCASVVRVRPRPRGAVPASSLLLRAVADAHKSLLSIPPKVDHETQKVKRALVLPMRRAVETQKIVIQVPVDTHSDSQEDIIRLGEMDSEGDDKTPKNTKKDVHNPHNITKVINNTEYNSNRTNRQDNNLLETITVHNTTVDKDKGTQFIVTMDGYHPNAFLAKKLMTEGLLDEDDSTKKLIEPLKPKQKDTNQTKENVAITENNNETTSIDSKKRISSTSEESETQVIINKQEIQAEKRKTENNEESKVDDLQVPPVKKRKASPIIFDVDKKENEKDKERIRERTVSASSDSVTLNTSASTHKYDDLPPLNQTERKPVWCRTFPLCRFGSSCAFQHPRCKFAAACTRRNCPYSHSPLAPLTAPTPLAPLAPLAPTVGVPLLASHVVPAANYKSISAVVPPSMCKFYPNCVNPACHYYHPKPCRFGKACTNKLECNFYHNDMPAKWKYSI
ncbi:zinc finger CCCH domain-containing protein 14 [Melitaea cinxia]|uniref:zinc finger CCCH domain-containing protein 14 n=1 Tax=Melitaea cinxia TaxID=113334 RepID=UPI001E26F828|nr:zinc finger CCCH domain-containing protein 14 [Melitaea cinxia]